MHGLIGTTSGHRPSVHAGTGCGHGRGMSRPWAPAGGGDDEREKQRAKSGFACGRPVGVRQGDVHSRPDLHSGAKSQRAKLLASGWQMADGGCGINCQTDFHWNSVAISLLQFIRHPPSAPPHIPLRPSQHTPTKITIAGPTRTIPPRKPRGEDDRRNHRVRRNERAHAGPVDAAQDAVPQPRCRTPSRVQRWGTCPRSSCVGRTR